MRSRSYLRPLQRSRTVRYQPPGSYVAFAGAETDGVVEESTFHATLQEWREFLIVGNGGLPTFLLDLGVPSGEVLATCRRMIDLLNGGIAEEFEDWCRRNGGSFFSGILTAIALVN